MTVRYSLDDVRANLPILESWTYLNTGTVGIMATPVLEKLIEQIALYEQGGHTTQAQVEELTERSRETLAELINADPEHIALNRNATDGINTVVAGFQLAPGDEVITSSEEHPAMVVPLLAACDRAGARLRFVEISPDPERFRQLLERIVTDKTRLVAISQVSCETGTRVPVQIVRGVVGPDVVILIDASQSVGQFPVDVEALNADFIIGNGHKWLAGPKGTGFAWFSPASIHLAPPVHFAGGTVDPGWSREHYQREPNPAIRLSDHASRFEFGTRAWHLHAGLHDAIDYQTALGWDQIEIHMSEKSSRLKQMLSEISGVTLWSPQAWSESSGLVTFSIEGWTGVEASQKLWDDYRIAQRRVESPSAIRVSCSYFTNDDDLDRLILALRELVL